MAGRAADMSRNRVPYTSFLQVHSQRRCLSAANPDVSSSSNCLTSTLSALFASRRQLKTNAREAYQVTQYASSKQGHSASPASRSSSLPVKIDL